MAIEQTARIILSVDEGNLLVDALCWLESESTRSEPEAVALRKRLERWLRFNFYTDKID